MATAHEPRGNTPTECSTCDIRSHVWEQFPITKKCLRQRATGLETNIKQQKKALRQRERSRNKFQTTSSLAAAGHLLRNSFRTKKSACGNGGAVSKQTPNNERPCGIGAQFQKQFSNDNKCLWQRGIGLRHKRQTAKSFCGIRA